MTMTQSLQAYSQQGQSKSIIGGNRYEGTSSESRVAFLIGPSQTLGWFSLCRNDEEKVAREARHYARLSFVGQGMLEARQQRGPAKTKEYILY